jgi:hypothetical protein
MIKRVFQTSKLIFMDIFKSHSLPLPEEIQSWLPVSSPVSNMGSFSLNKRSRGETLTSRPNLALKFKHTAFESWLGVNPP